MALAELSEASHLSQAIGAALGLREIPNQDIVETLIQLLNDRLVLLILDNCEHLLNACVNFSAALLQRHPTSTY